MLLRNISQMTSGFVIVVCWRGNANRGRKALPVMNSTPSRNRATYFPLSSNKPSVIQASVNIENSIPSTIRRFSKLVACHNSRDRGYISYVSLISAIA